MPTLGISLLSANPVSICFNPCSFSFPYQRPFWEQPSPSHEVQAVVRGKQDG